MRTFRRSSTGFPKCAFAQFLRSVIPPPVVLEGREMYPSDEQFGRWVKGNLPVTEQKERGAAMWAAANPEEFLETKKAHPWVRTVRGLHANLVETHPHDCLVDARIPSQC